MGSFKLARVEELPDWLADDEVGRPYQEVLGAAQDAESRRLKDAVLASIPGPYMPEDALPYAAADKLLERAPGETAAAFVTRLQQAVDSAVWWGTKRGTREIFAVFGVADADVRVFDDHETSFGFDGLAESPWWSRTWVVLDSTGGPWEPVYWDDGELWDSGTCWDSTMTAAELAYLKRRFRRQKSPLAYLGYVMLVLLPDAWDIGEVWDVAGDRWDGAIVVVGDRNTDTFTATGHGFVDGDRVQFTATALLLSPIVEGTEYWIVNADADTFQVALTEGGAAIDLDENSFATTYAIPVPVRQAVVPLKLWPLWDEGEQITGEGVEYWDAGHVWDEEM